MSAYLHIFTEHWGLDNKWKQMKEYKERERDNIEQEIDIDIDIELGINIGKR